MELIRAFVAVELPPDVTANLAQVQERLKLAGDGFVKWVRPEGIHLTLKFLGNVAASRVEQIGLALGEVAGGVAPFVLQIERPGVFPHWKQPRVTWVGLGGEVERLLELQKRVDETLANLGFPPEARPFSPHLTIGRLKEGTASRDRQRFGECVAQAEGAALLRFSVAIISLMRSQLTPAGAIYSRLISAQLGIALPKTPL